MSRKAKSNKSAPVVAPVIAETRKIQKDRASANGLTRPSAGSKCNAVWEHVEANPAGTVQQAIAWGSEHGLNRNNVQIEFYRAHKFFGTKPGKAPRAKKTVEAPAVTA